MKNNKIASTNSFIVFLLIVLTVSFIMKLQYDKIQMLKARKIINETRELCFKSYDREQYCSDSLLKKNRIILKKIESEFKIFNYDKEMKVINATIKDIWYELLWRINHDRDMLKLKQ